MKKALILFYYFSIAIFGYGADFYAFQSGNYTNVSIWRIGSCSGALAGTTPSASDNVYICNGVTVSVASNITCANLHVWGTFNIEGNRTINITSNLTLYNGSLLSGDNNNANLYVLGNLIFHDGATINGTQPFNLRVTGTMNNVSDGGPLFSSVGRVDIWIEGMSFINGDFIFTITGQGTKRFNGGITVTTTGTFDNTVGEDPYVNGNIVNDGNWIGCTGGNCVYFLGSIAGRIINITGTNPITLSSIRIPQATAVVNNYNTVILDRTDNNASLIRENGTFNNYGTLYLGRGSDVAIEPTVTFRASFAGNTVHYYKNGNQQIRIPNDGSYYNLVVSNTGTKILQTAGGTLTINNNLIIEDNVILQIGATETLNGAASLEMEGNSILRILKCSGPSQPELTGNYILNGGTIELAGNCNQTYNSTPVGSTTVNNLNLSGSGTKNISGINQFNGNLTISGSAVLGAYSFFTQSCTASFIYSSSATSTLSNNLSIGNFEMPTGTTGTINASNHSITVCGNFWRYNGGTFNPQTSTVIFNGETSIVGSLTPLFNNIVINNSKKLYAHIAQTTIRGNFINQGEFYHRNGTIAFDYISTILGASITTFNNITITANGNLTSHSNIINVEGNFTNHNTFNHNSGTVIFTGNNSSTIDGSVVSMTFYRFFLNKNSTSAVVTQNLSNVVVSNLLEIVEGTYNVGTNTLSGTGGLTMTGGILQIAKLATVPELTGTYNLTGGTVHLNGAGNQTLGTSSTGGNTYNNLIFSNSGNKVISGLTTINGDVRILGSAFISGNSIFTQNENKTFYYMSSANSTIGDHINIGNFYQDNGTISVNNNFNVNVKGVNYQKVGGSLTLNDTARLFFNGTATQYYSDNSASPNLNNVTVDNSSGLILNSDLRVSNSLHLLNGVISTQSNEVYMVSNTHTLTRTNGFINGWLERNLPSGTYNRLYPLGCNITNYTPITINFTTSTTGGDLKIGAFEPDHPDIFASNIDPNKTVNVYWKINNTISGVKELTFSYPSVLVDMEAIPEEFVVGKYNVPDFTQITPTGIPTSTQIIISGLDVLTGDYIIGNKYNPEFMYNANIGNINWNNINNWIQYRTGIISCNTSSNEVTGISTLFTTEISVGDYIALQSSPQNIIGIVQTIVNDNLLILTANATVNATNASFGRKKLPEINDIVNIGNPILSSANVHVTLDIDAQVHQLNFTAMARSNTLTFQDERNLFVRTNVNLQVPSTTTNTNTLNINNGTTTIQGNLIIGRGGTTNRSAVLNLVNGRIDIGTNLVFNSATPASSATLSITGTGRINLGGNFILTNSSTNYGTFNPGSNSIFCYCSNTNPQTANFNSTAPAVNYAHLHFGNTSTNGATIPASITATRVTGNLIVESGLFYYGSNFSVTGNTGRIFNVKNGATFRLLNTATFPTTFTYNLEAGSTVEVKTTASTNMPVVNYGFLKVIPDANGYTPRFNAGGTVQVFNDLIVGNGTNTMTLDLNTNDPDLTVSGNIILYPNATFVFSNLAKTINLRGNWINNGGTVTNVTQSTLRFVGTTDQEITGTVSSQTFPNVEIDKPSGVVRITGNINTLNTNAFTFTRGDFYAPANLNLTNSNSAHLTIQANGRLLDNNSTITIYGNWINNGGQFVYGNSNVIFSGNLATQTIGGTLALQTFNNIEINKTGGIVQQNINTIEVRNYKQYNRTFQAQNGGSTLRVLGNFELLNTATFNGTNVTNLYIAGNIIHNSTGTWTMSQNVYLNGTTQQTISGTSAIPSFTNLFIDNTIIDDAILTNKPLIVNGTLTLTRGQIVTTLTNPLEVGASGSIILNAPGGNQALCYVEGPLIHNVNTNTTVTKVFPVGRNNVYHRIDLEIRQASSTNTKYTGQFFTSSASSLGWTLPPSIVRVSNKGHWEIDKGSGANVSQAAVICYYDPVFDDVTDAATLRIAKGNPSAWTDIGGNIIATNTIRSTTNFTTFSKFSLASTQLTTNPLPINLVSFSGECKNNNVHLAWTTSSEINNDYFEIQRSYNGFDFEKIAIVDGAGNSNEWKTYWYMDPNVQFSYYNFIYYKLKQVDFDHQFSYSDPISVLKCKDELNGFSHIRVGLSENHIVILFNENVYEEITINIVDLAGKILISGLYPLNGQNTLYIPKSNLSSGIYNVVIKTKDGLYSYKALNIR